MASYGLTLVTAPTSEPISLDEAKIHCNVDLANAYHEGKLQSLIKAAREKVETDTGRAIVTQTWDFTCDLFPSGVCAMHLPKSPVSSVTSVKYYDTTATVAVPVLAAGRDYCAVRLRVSGNHGGHGGS